MCGYAIKYLRIDSFDLPTIRLRTPFGSSYEYPLSKVIIWSPFEKFVVPMFELLKFLQTATEVKFFRWNTDLVEIESKKIYSLNWFDSDKFWSKSAFEFDNNFLIVHYSQTVGG